jgi:hypothetical protein
MSEFKKQSDQGYGTTPYTGETPNEVQYQQEHSDYFSMPQKPVQSFGWVLRGSNPKYLTLIDIDNINNALSALGMSEDHFNAYAIGTCDITSRWTLSVVVYRTNMDIETLFGVFKRWANNPVFKNWASPHMVKDGDEERWPHRLELTSFKNPNGIDFSREMKKTGSEVGFGDGTLYPWKKTDQSLLNETQIWNKDQGNFPGKDTMSAGGGKPMTKPGQCPTCFVTFLGDDGLPDENALREHMGSAHIKGDKTGPEYEIHDKGGINGDSYDNEASRPPGDDIMMMGSFHLASPEGPIPFSFDIEQDRLYVGDPGDEGVKVDRENPFGLAEGYYTPDGDLLITAQSNIPYTISHLTRLWENMNPEYEIKHIYIIRKEGDTNIKEKVANA